MGAAAWGRRGGGVDAALVGAWCSGKGSASAFRRVEYRSWEVSRVRGREMMGWWRVADAERKSCALFDWLVSLRNSGVFVYNGIITFKGAITGHNLTSDQVALTVPLLNVSGITMELMGLSITLDVHLQGVSSVKLGKQIAKGAVGIVLNRLAYRYGVKVECERITNVSLDPIDPGLGAQPISVSSHLNLDQHVTIELERAPATIKADLEQGPFPQDDHLARIDLVSCVSSLLVVTACSERHPAFA